MKVTQTSSIWIFWFLTQLLPKSYLLSNIHSRNFKSTKSWISPNIQNFYAQIMRKILLPILKFCRKVQEYFHEFKVFSQAKTESITLKVSIIIFPQTLNSIADSLPSYHPVFAIIYNNVRWITLLVECVKLHNEAKLVQNVTFRQLNK